jgi:hypothetical protein
LVVSLLVSRDAKFWNKFELQSGRETSARARDWKLLLLLLLTLQVCPQSQDLKIF